jgi:glycerophosphoryl diester phosphodiesterase
MGEGGTNEDTWTWRDRIEWRYGHSMRWRGFVIAIVVGLVAGTTPRQAAAEETADVWEQRRVLDVAHAGGDLEAPHSTLFAMKAAVRAGADVLEMDVRLSADGVLVVHHDETLDRTTNATGAVRDRTLAELQALDNAYWFVPNCWSCHDRPDAEYQYRGVRSGSVPVPAGFAPDDFTIPTLAQVAAAFPSRLLDVEIKDGVDGIAAANALAAFIADHGPADRYLVASFDDDILAHFKALAPHVATSPGLNETIDWFATREAMPHHVVLQVPPVFSGIEVVTQQFVDDAHADGLAVWVWFNGTEDDSPHEWNRLIGLGVDALLTGKPRAAQSQLLVEGAAFRAAPDLAADFAHRRGRLHIDYECPVVHVDRCRSLILVVTKHADGAVTFGVRLVGARRGTTRELEFRGFVGRRRSVETVVLAIPINDDTAFGAVAAMPWSRT